MKQNYILVLVLLLNSLSVFSQRDTTKKFCDPKLEGMGRSKGVYISYERVLNSSVSSTSTDPSIGEGSAVIKRNNKFDFKLNIPLWNRPGLKAVIGIRYFLEEFEFETPENLDYSLYKNLQDKNLKSIGGNLNILKPINETTYAGVRILGELNGDYSSDNFSKSEFLKYSVAAFYGWKPCPTRTTAVGLYYSYKFGRRSIAPVLIYGNTFNKKWGIEAMLPVEAKMRHNFSEKTLLYFGYEIQGAAYHVEILNPPLESYPKLELRRSDLRILGEFNQEIHDWLWFGVIAGIRQPISYNLAKDPGGRKNKIIDNTVNATPFFNVSLFIVPPRTLEQRLLNAK